jgi:hypothetical protein
VTKAAEQKASKPDAPRFAQLADWAARAIVEAQEEVAATFDRTWVTLENKEWGKTFQVDRSDPKNIVVKVKVRVNATEQMRKKVHALEDAIEKHLRIPGFTVDLVFTNGTGKDVFEVNADPTGWTTASNWVGTAEALAHELLHVLGLDDEYDYIESHATNANMALGTRLHWFTVEMKRSRPADGHLGVMSYHGNKPLDRHACEVAKLEVDACVQARTGKKYAKFGANAPSNVVPLAPLPRASGVCLHAAH